MFASLKLSQFLRTFEVLVYIRTRSLALVPQKLPFPRPPPPPSLAISGFKHRYFLHL